MKPLQLQFIAQGKYHYQLAQRDSGLTEAWTLHRTPTGLWVHEAKIQGRVGIIHLKQTLHLTMMADYRPQHLEMHQQINENEAQTTIEFQDNVLQQTITANDQTEQRTVATPPHYGLFLPPVSLQGFILTHYDRAQGGRQPLSLVTIRMQPEDNLPLSADVRQVDYEYCEEEEVETLAGQFACRHFRRYEQHMTQDLWLDKDDIPIQWSVPYSPVMKWDYLLAHYQRG